MKPYYLVIELNIDGKVNELVGHGHDLDTLTAKWESNTLREECPTLHIFELGQVRRKIVRFKANVDHYND